MTDTMSTTKEKVVILWEETDSIEPRMKSENNGESGECDIIESINDSKEPVLSTDIIGKKKVSGIYKIINKVNGKYYVGSSNNICDMYKCRWSSHIGLLKSNKHYNDYLQRSWNKYGKNNFEFIVVEECNPKNLIKIEQKYLTIAFKEKEKCYNLSFEATNPGKFPDYVIQKMRNAQLGIKNHMYGKRGKLSPLFGKHPTEEARKNMSKAQKDRKVNAKTKRKMSISKRGLNNPFYKIGPTNAIIASSIKRQKAVIHIDKNGNVINTFPSIKIAAKTMNIPTASISRVCSGEYQHTHGLFFKFEKSI